MGKLEDIKRLIDGYFKAEPDALFIQIGDFLDSANKGMDKQISLYLDSRLGHHIIALLKKDYDQRAKDLEGQEDRAVKEIKDILQEERGETKDAFSIYCTVFDGIDLSFQLDDEYFYAAHSGTTPSVKDVLTHLSLFYRLDIPNDPAAFVRYLRTRYQIDISYNPPHIVKPNIRKLETPIDWVKYSSSRDLSPVLKMFARRRYTRVSELIDYLNQNDEADIPNDETEFANYLLKNYQIGIDFTSDGAFFVSEDADSIRKLTEKERM